MINFDTDLDRGTVTVTAPTVDVVVTTRRPSAGRTHLVSSEVAWTWEQLRDYVISRIEAIHGPFPRDPMKEASIFRSFVSRWPEKAGGIAKFAFEECDGMWHNAPIQVTRFCKGSDPYFAAPIAERL